MDRIAKNRKSRIFLQNAATTGTVAKQLLQHQCRSAEFVHTGLVTLSFPATSTDLARARAIEVQTDAGEDCLPQHACSVYVCVWDVRFAQRTRT